MKHLLQFRLFHWGPITGLIVIKCITLTTLYFTDMWFSFNKSLPALINHIIFLLLVCLTLNNFFFAIFVGPGHVPQSWEPENKDDIRYLQRCNFCESYKCPRAHHCRKCNKCILKMDHHCPWINNCVGHFNQYYFTLFLLFAVLGALHASILLSIAIYRGFYANWYFYNDNQDEVVLFSFKSFLFCIFSSSLAIGVVVAVGSLLIVQIKNILKNRTTIEDWIVIKALARDREDEFIYPYDLGKWENFKQVFCSPLGSGIYWKVITGQFQYSLTKEQLLQKEKKRKRARLYKAITPYSGSWFPIFSYEFKTCIKFPISDEPRMSLEVGDIINVTRWKDYWLYGEKINSKLRTKINPRGWFPRKAVIDIYEGGDNINHLNKLIKSSDYKKYD